MANTGPLFPLGTLGITPGAMLALEESNEIFGTFLHRHWAGDWGEVDAEDKAANDSALKTQLRLLSVYHTAKGQKLYIITEADRSATTILTPDEY